MKNQVSPAKPQGKGSLGVEITSLRQQCSPQRGWFGVEGQQWSPNVRKESGTKWFRAPVTHFIGVK